MLHIVKTVQALEDVSRVATESDKVLLVEQAVYAANPLHHAFPSVKGLNTSVLAADVEARGIANRVSSSVRQVDFDGFVELTIEQPNCVTWE
ncbi:MULTISPECIES: sulfurtransferase complex subunit TusB [Vibrio]|uniref:Sulfur relay protein TusB n=1 Tax=Vibrio bivalvicida TaxID=1276888 RepID=A0A177XY97_9VIBR|nr:MULTISPECIES: sulfurtransferase complex subunit TusB [Vibrio]KLN67148.1 sulfur relay protein TusB [Vibrio sp. VPAP30]OAJ93563.1 sulfur relay protein TusB [Vibrio bivalvicida]